MQNYKVIYQYVKFCGTFVYLDILQTARTTGGSVAAKYPAERHISIAPIIATTIEKERSTSEKGNSVSIMVIS